MSILLNILLWIGIVLLGLIGLLLILLLIPATLEIRYEKSYLALYLRYFLLRLRLYDANAPAAAADAKDTAEEVNEEVKEKTGLDIGLIRRLLDPGFRALKTIVRGLRFRNVRIVLVASGGDPADIGIAAGRMWAALGGVMTLAGGIWRNIDYQELTVIPDFTGEYKGKARFCADIRALPFSILVTAWVLFVRYRRIRRDLDRTAKRNESAEATVQK